MIELHQVQRNYGNKLAVAGIDLTVPQGELFAFLGPNGAGKTTTIKMIVGLLRPSAGMVRICGFDVVHQPREASRRLGYVPDEPYLYDKLSGREFLQFIAELYGIDGTDATCRIGEVVEQFELSDFIDDLEESYSHGMKQRVAFAAAFLHNPQVMVLDEPMVGLDPRSMRLVKDLLHRKAQQGMAIFMSTHTLAMAEEIADRIGIVDQGRLRFLGTLEQLRQTSALQHTSLEQLYLELTSPSGTV